MRSVLLILLVAATAHASPTAPQIAANVQTYYAKVSHLQAKFRQEVTNPTFGRTTKSEGTVWLARPLAMHWDYVRKTSVKKQFISDGKTLWVVDHDNQEIIIEKIDKSVLPASIAFLVGGDLGKTYKLALDASGTYGAKTDAVLSLTPKKANAQVKRQFLVVDPTDAHVKESIVIDTADNVNHFVFDAVDTTTDPPAGAFAPDPKLLTSYEVIIP